MELLCKNRLLTLCVLVAISASVVSLKPRVPNPGKASELLPETKAFLKKLEAATSVQDIKRLQEEDETFMVHDFSESPPGEKATLKKPDPSSCKAAPKDDTQTPSPNAKDDVLAAQETVTLEGVGAASEGIGDTEAPDSVPNETTTKPDSGSESGADAAAKGAAGPEASNYTVEEEEDIDDIPQEDVMELVDFGSPSDVTDQPSVSGFDKVRYDHRSLASSVERRMQEPATERPKTSRADKQKGKGKKKKRPEPPPAPTKEELEESYKYEVLAPPDNSPVTLDFPATPQAQGEEHLSRHLPLTLYCDTCMALAYQLHASFAKFHSQVTRRPPTESEIYHMVAETCQPPRFREYGMLEVHGHRHISGPGCNELEAEGGVKHSRGPWPRRLAERCEEVTEDIGELTLHAAWLREQRDPERFKAWMCFGEPPRDYCQKYGHMDAAAEAAARVRSKEPEDTETPIEMANRLAREAEEAENRRLAEIAARNASRQAETAADGPGRDEL